MRTIVAILLLLPMLCSAQSRRLLLTGSSSLSPTPDILWWKFTDGSGVNITSAIGEGGTNSGTWVTGKSGTGYGLDYNGTNQKSGSSNSIAYNTNIITMTWWMNARTTNATQIVIGSSTNENFFAYTFEFYILSTSRIEVDLHGNNTAGALWRIESCAFGMTTNAWHHWAVVLDNSTSNGDIKIYIDGSERSTTIDENDKGSAANLASKVLYVGARGFGSSYANIQVDDLRVFSGELSAASIVAIMNDPQ